MSFQLTFTLAQHTPIIHFQYEQEGSSIRPTELKSKLDKWLIAHYTSCYGLVEERLEMALSNDQLKNWIKHYKDSEPNGKPAHPSLDYAVRIKTTGENLFIDEIKPEENNNKLTGIDYPTFFGNQMSVADFRKGEKKVKRLSYRDLVTITIESVHTELLEKIKEEFPKFLLHTNFGTRQSKGFGSFFLVKGSEAYPPDVENFFKQEFIYFFDVSNIASDEREIVKNLFTKIEIFCKDLRGSINPQDLLGLSYEQNVRDAKHTRFKSPVFLKPIRIGKDSFRIFFEVPDFIIAAFKKGKNSGLPEAEILGESFQKKSNIVSFPNEFDYARFLTKFFKNNHHDVKRVQQ